ncbi:MAG TPA: ATP-binding protein, partial [Alphaproteobacteria bacterium]|nr:ATP-binding protein [Alphaproteobacteria bacterium]
IRMLRPLLDVSRAEIEAALAHRRQPFVHDPSNLDPAYARARVRRLAPALEAEGLSAARLAATSARLNRARHALENAAAGLIAQACAPHPAGFVRLDLDAFKKAPAEIALRALARVLLAVSGASYPPRLDALERLLQGLGEGRGRTLLGLRLMPWDGAFLVCREATAERIELGPGETRYWDHRFRFTLAPQTRRRRGLAAGTLAAGALGAAGLAALGPAGRGLRTLPRPALESLPALFDLDGPLAVPHLHYCRGCEFDPRWFEAAFRPANGLASYGYAGPAHEAG